jgi:hypothetical protein
MRRIGRFGRDEEGGLSVEFVVLFPFLMLLYFAMFVFWDVFQAQCVTVRATETIADMMSRETGSFDAAYLEGMHEVFDWLTSARAETRLRMTVVATSLDAEGGEVFEVLWSRASGAGLPEIDAATLARRVPTPAVGEQLIVVETFYAHAPLFDVGFPPRELHSLIATRPRYVPQALWSGA